MNKKDIRANIITYIKRNNINLSELDQNLDEILGAKNEIFTAGEDIPTGEVAEVLDDILGEPRVYKLMKKDENKVYDVFPEGVEPETIGFKWETDCDGNWHYWCEFIYQEDDEREDSVFSLADASIWKDDYHVHWDEDMADEEYEEARAEADRAWDEAQRYIENNYYIFSQLA